MKICKDSRLCFLGDAPVLSELNMAYGELTATMWLVPQLYDLSEYCGCKDKLQGKPLEECASVIATEFYYLKVSEIMLFLHWFKAGRFGKFYGSVDPLVITSSLRDFIKQRNFHLDEYKKEEERIASESAKRTSVTYEQYCEKKGIPVGANPLIRPIQRKEAPKKEGKKYEPEYIRKMAEGLVNNIYNADSKTLATMKRFFEKDYGCTPEDWLNGKS